MSPPPQHQVLLQGIFLVTGDSTCSCYMPSSLNCPFSKQLEGVVSACEMGNAGSGCPCSDLKPDACPGLGPFPLVLSRKQDSSQLLAEGNKTRGWSVDSWCLLTATPELLTRRGMTGFSL